MSKKETDKNGWDVSSNRYVAFIDIMGFKNMVATRTSNEIHKMMKGIQGKIKILETLPWKEKIKEYVDGAEIKATTYSDSIMIYTKDDSEESANLMLITMSSLTSYLLRYTIPFKGAIAFGDMTLDRENSIFFGQPLIDAFQLQEELLFYGMIIHGSAEKHISYSTDAYLEFRNNFLIEYQCPLKNGSASHRAVIPLYTLNAMNTAAQNRQQQMVDSLEKMRYTTSGHLRKYIDNTDAFLTAILSTEVDETEESV